MKIAAFIVLAGCACANAQVWNEVGDAGQSIASAQVPSGVGSLATINGSLSNDNDVDLYCIHITDVTLFHASVSAFVGDSMLFLFNMNGTVQVWNDDFGSGFLSTITDQGVFANGHYILGISSFGNYPRNSGNNVIAANSVWAGPDAQQRQGTGGILAGWTGNGDSHGNYEITLRGVEYCIPTPGAAALLGLGGLASMRRRR